MLTKNSLEKIDKELLKFPAGKSRSVLISALRIAQEEHNYLSTELIEYVANYLQVPPVQALEVATFYSMFNLNKVGKYKLSICTNLPCALQGAVNTADYLKEKLGINFGETTKDGKFTLVETECMGSCGDAPLLVINNHKMCAFMNKEVVDKKLAELK